MAFLDYMLDELSQIHLEEDVKADLHTEVD